MFTTMLSRFKTVLSILLLLSEVMGVQAAQAQDVADMIQKGDRKAALELISQGADVNALQPDGTSALHWAVYSVDNELVDALIRAEARADVINSFGSSALSEAITLGNVALVEKLLNAGADANYRNQDNQTALMLAAEISNFEIAALLVERGADVNVIELMTGQTALMWAAAQGSAEITALLVDNGADVKIRSYVNDWPSQITSEPRGQYRPAAGLTALQFAARSGCIQCLDSILEAGAEIDEPTPEGVTPLMIAIDNSNFDAALHLLDEGANPFIWDWWGRTPLYCAVDMSRGGAAIADSFGRFLSNNPDSVPRANAIDVARRLLDMGVEVNAQLNFHRPGRGGGSGRFVDDLLNTGATPVLRATINTDMEMMELLVSYGADVNLPNAMGATPFMAAAGQGVSTRDRRDYSLAGQEAAIRSLEFLLESGAEVNARIQDVSGPTARIARPSTMTERGGQTALYGAIKFAWTDVVTWLVEHGAQVNIHDDLGVTPLDAAEGRIGGRDNEVSEEVADILRSALEQGA